MKRVAYTSGALKTLRRLPLKVSKLIVSKIEQYASDPVALANNVKRLQGRDAFRLRVGDWRIIFTDDGVVIAIERIAPRGKAYK